MKQRLLDAAALAVAAALVLPTKSRRYVLEREPLIRVFSAAALGLLS